MARMGVFLTCVLLTAPAIAQDPYDDYEWYEEYDGSQTSFPVGQGRWEVTLGAYGWNLRTAPTQAQAAQDAIDAANDRIAAIIAAQKASIEDRGYTVYSYTTNLMPVIVSNDYDPESEEWTAKAEYGLSPAGQTTYEYGNPN